MADWISRTDDLVMAKALADGFKDLYESRRSAFWHDAMEAYEEDPSRDRFNCDLGRVSITFNKEVKPVEVRELMMTVPPDVGDPFEDNDEFRDFVHKKVCQNIEAWAQDYFKDGGEILDGFGVVTVQRPGKPRTPKTIMVTKDKKKVNERVREVFGTKVAGLLEA